jgi:hypothetical protein
MRQTLPKIPLVALMLLSVGLLTGCGRTRTVYVQDGEPVRLRQPVKAKIWALDKDGKEVEGEMVLPEGWWALPDTGDKPK